MGVRAAAQNWLAALRRILGACALVVVLVGLALPAAPGTGSGGEATRHLAALHLATAQSPATGQVPCAPAMSCMVVVLPSPASPSLRSGDGQRIGPPPQLAIPSGADAAPQTPPPRHAV